jgi:hypothetical protein
LTASRLEKRRISSPAAKASVAVNFTARSKSLIPNPYSIRLRRSPVSIRPTSSTRESSSFTRVEIDVARDVHGFAPNRQIAMRSYRGVINHLTRTSKSLIPNPSIIPFLLFPLHRRGLVAVDDAVLAL